MTNSMQNPLSPNTNHKIPNQLNLWKFLESLGQDAQTRPQPSLTNALSGVSGAVIALGWTALLSGNSDSKTGIYVGALIAFAVGVVIRLKVSKPAELQSSAVGAGIMGLVILCITFIADTGMDAGIGLILTAAVHVAAWLLPGFRGRSIFLGLGALTLIFGISSLVGGELLTSDRCQQIYEENGDVPEACYEDSPFSDLPGEVSSLLGKQGVVYLITGSTLILAIAAFDRRGYRTAGTALVPSGVIAVLLGAVLAAISMANAGAGIIAAISGLVLCYVGSQGQRRAMLWWGTFTTTAGVIGFFVAAIQPESTSGQSLVIILAGLVIAVSPFLIKKAKRTNAIKPSEFAPPTSPPSENF